MQSKVSDATFKDILSRELGLHNFPRRWMPYQLCEAHKKLRFDLSVEVLAFLDQYSELQFGGIATGNESWCCSLIESESICAGRREKATPRLRPGFSIKKVKITIVSH
jgi:hypothetical protein